MDWDHWDKRLAAKLKSYEPLREDGKELSAIAHGALTVVKGLSALASFLPGEVGQLAKEVFEALHHMEPLEHTGAGHGEHKAAPDKGEAEQDKTELDKTEQVKTGLDKTELDKATEQVKAEMVKADAERAAAVIEEQTVIVEQEIVDEPGKSTAERDVIEQEFKLEKQRRETKLDDMERNYFEKHPDLSKDQREKAEETFQGIKEKEMGNLSRERETRLEELAHAQDKHREELAERLEELEGTRARS